MRPLGKSDHITLEVEVERITIDGKQHERHKEKRDYGRASFTEHRSFFEGVNRSDLKEIVRV